jgi:chitinase
MLPLVLLLLCFIRCTVISGLTFGPYFNVATFLDYNTYVMKTEVTGTLKPLVEVLPSLPSNITILGFATGECGSEVWAGGVSTLPLISTNLPGLVSAKLPYIISTGGASGIFTCFTDANFEIFINRYLTTSLIGFDFDIEGNRLSSAQISSIVTRVKNAQTKFPGLRWSFTITTKGLFFLLSFVLNFFLLLLLTFISFFLSFCLSFCFQRRHRSSIIAKVMASK